MKSKIISSTLLILGFIIGASALSALADWSVPGCAPTGCNAPAPLNAATSTQSKVGPLQVNWNLVNPATIGLQLNGRIQINGAPGDTAVNTAGSVLTNMGGGVGTWQNVALGGGGTPMSIIECTKTVNHTGNPYEQAFTFVAGDCDGSTLPDSTYTGAVKSVKLASGSVHPLSFAALDADETSGPGISLVQSGAMSAFTVLVKVVYIKPGIGGATPGGLVVGGYKADNEGSNNFDVWGVANTVSGCPTPTYRTESTGNSANENYNHFQCLTK